MRSVVIVSLGLAILVIVGIVAFLFLQPAGSAIPGRNFTALTQSAVPEHLDKLKKGDLPARRQAARDLWQIGSYAREATPALLEAVKDPDPQLREMAAKALGRASEGTPVAVPALAEALKDDQVAVRAAAAVALGEIWRADHVSTGSNPLVRGSMPAPGTPDTAERRPAPPPLIQLRADLEPTAKAAILLLIETLRDQDANVRARAGQALGETGPLAQPATAALTEVLGKDVDWDARLWAAIALGNIGPGARSAVPVLSERLLHDKAEGVRGNCAASLAMIHADPDIAVPALVEAFVHDPNPDNRRLCLMALHVFGPDAKIAIPILQAAAKAPEDPKNKEALERINRLLELITKNLGEPSAPAKTTPAAQGAVKSRGG